MTHYVRHSTLSIAEGLKLVADNMEVKTRPFRVPVNETKINVVSTRLRTFVMHGTKCSCCGLEADHFAIERSLADDRKDGPYHMNMWAGNVLFTHDHTLARSLGGSKDDPANLTTMCTVCNGRKAVEEQRLLAEARARKVFINPPVIA